jgi:hypothetical protein
MPAKAAGCRRKQHDGVTRPDLGLRIPGWLQNAGDEIAAILGRCTTVSSFVTISPSSISAMPAMDLHVVADTWPVFSTTSYSIMPTRDHI